MALTNIEVTRRYREKNRELIRQRQNDRYASEGGRAQIKKNYAKYMAQPWARIKSLIKMARQRSVARDCEFDPGILDILVGSHEACGCCGQELDFSVGNGISKASPSIDRFDNSKGYSTDNVRLICFWCNHIKGEATIEDLEVVLAYMKRVT